MPANPAAARAFNAMHREGLLVLANAWDAGTARLAQGLGARAVATTSAGVAWANGYADGAVMPADVAVEALRRILRVAAVPVTADIENGYADDPAAVAEVVTRVVEAGAAGVNIEDGGGPPDLLAAKIEAARAAASALGVDLFINARTDIWLRGLLEGEAAVEEVLSRAALYRAAGASGLFAAGVVEPGEIRALAQGCGMPLNVLARPGLPDAATLAELGVRRLSAGSWISESAFALVARLSADFLAEGDSGPLVEKAMAYREINALMAAPVETSPAQ